MLKYKNIKILISVLMIFSLFVGCQRFDIDYNSDNLMANLHFANEQQFAKGYAEDIYIPNKNTNQIVDNISAKAYYISSLYKNKVNFIKYKNPYEQLPIASLTKMMTALIIFENCENLDEIYEVPADAVNLEKTASVANLSAGDKLTVRDLLYALLLPSGNDAAITLALNLAGGSMDNFVIMMNNEAQRLGALKTHFVNPHGLSSEFHYSTCYDLYLIIRELLKYPMFSTISSSRVYKSQVVSLSGVTKELTWENTNYFVMGEMAINSNVSFVAGKTGYTQSAGDCLAIVSKSKKDDEEFISIVLNATSKSNMYRNTNKLLSVIG